MAYIRQRGNSFNIIVSCGYGSDHGKLTESMTWTPPKGMTEKKIKEALAKVSDDFENKVKNGHYLDGEKITFAEFSDRWLKDYAEKQLKPKTYLWYKQLLQARINPAIGHIMLAKLQPSQLIKFINALQEPGINHNQKYIAKDGIRAIWKASKMKTGQGIERHTLTVILAKKPVNFSTAEKFSKQMGKKVNDLFSSNDPNAVLSLSTVGHYMRCLSSVLSTAVTWQIIESNPCRRVKPPRADAKTVKHLDIDDAQSLIKAALALADPQLQIIVLIMLYTGMRRGELSGLQWPDIDLDNGTIMIRRGLQQIPGQGYIISGTKTASGERLISISPDLVSYLKRYRTWQNEQRLKLGASWQENSSMPGDWIITAWNGNPLNPATIYHKVKELLTINGHPDMTVHGLRHTNISLMLGQGVDLITASRRAGHAKPSTTSNIYAHALRRPDEKAADKINELFKQPATSGR